MYTSMRSHQSNDAMRTGSALSGAMSDSPEDHMDWELLEVEDVIATIKEDLGHTKDVAEEVALVESQSGVQASRTKREHPLPPIGLTL
jgi:hypothetical protein